MSEPELFADDHIHTTPDGRHFRHGDGAEVDGEGNPLPASRGKVVFTGTEDWWEIVSQGEIEVSDAWPAGWERAADAADLNTDDEESWVCRVGKVDARHTAIQPGDYVCCQGYGSDVVFVRI